ncbi:MAG TPA: hypothetical protein VFS08_20375 [Gemmatimonadaceae bacterium]|nr:hypothetical protein [Gemmatimonadaceae bacterium]
MPASEVVQLVLWPQTVADWARESHVATAVAYNMLSRFKPYRRVRELLAHRLEVPAFVVDHLVDAPRPLPRALALPRAEDDTPVPAPPTPRHPVPPSLHLPAVRDGSNPIEQRAVWHVWRELAAVPASLLVQIALFPETLADWARRAGVPPSMVYGMLAGTQPHPGLREALARRLDVPRHALDRVVDGVRRDPAVPRPIPLADAPPPRPGEAPRAAGPPAEPPTVHPPTDRGTDGDDDRRQLSLEL